MSAAASGVAVTEPAVAAAQTKRKHYFFFVYAIILGGYLRYVTVSFKGTVLGTVCQCAYRVCVPGYKNENERERDRTNKRTATSVP